MKTAKRATALIIAFVMLVAAPLTAMALPAGGYVPTKSTVYIWEDQNWVKSYDRDLTYKGDGKISKEVRRDSEGSSVITYKWKGNHVVKIQRTGSWSSTSTYKYKGNKLMAYSYVSSDVTQAEKFTWKKNTGKTQTQNSKETITLNKKGQVVKAVYTYDDGSTYTETYKYYGNGNKKSYTWKSSDETFVEKFNSSGYLTSQKQTGSFTYSATYTYKKNKKGQITERHCKYNNGTSSGQWKTVYSKWKKVSHVMNCDGFCCNVPLG